ncbi:MAG TPA: cytochrome c [Kofleriaceae bacterium]
MRMLSVVAAGLVFCVACSKNDEPPPPSTGSPMAQPESGPKGKRPSGGAPSEKAQAMFMTVCATCHGADGTGTGPAAETLTTKPRNYTDAAWQASVTDDDLRKIITLGGQAVGKSPLMPGNPQLKDEPETLDGLVKIIRGFGKQ